MRLISDEEYHRLKEQLHKPPVDVEKRSFSDKQINAENLLSDGDIPDDIKTVMYSQLLRNLVNKLDIHLPKNTKDKSKTNDIELPRFTRQKVEKVTASDKLLLKAIPHTYREKAEHILSALRRRSDLISWNALGKCTIYGKEEPDSNIIDLINYTITSTKWNRVPVGINRFLRICKDMNIPSSVVNSKLKHEFIRGNIEPRGSRLSAEMMKNANMNTFGWQSFVSDHEDAEEFGTLSESATP